MPYGDKNFEANNWTHVDNHRKHEDTAQKISVELLQGGHINAYKEFFELVESKSLGRQNYFKLHELKKHLIAWEDARRTGDLRDLYSAHQDLGHFFISIKKPSMAIKYYNTALEKSRMLGDPSVEILAIMNLGACMEANTDYVPAIKLFDESRAKAMESRDQNREKQVAMQTIAARLKYAKQQEDGGNIDEAIDQYIRCNDLVYESSLEPENVEELDYLLGRAYQKKGAYANAISHLQTYLAVSKDLQKVALARLHLSNIYTSQKDYEAALQHLDTALQIVNDPTQKPIQAKVLMQLGIVHEKMGNSDKARAWMERGFQTSCEADCIERTPAEMRAFVDNVLADPDSVLDEGHHTADEEIIQNAPPITPSGPSFEVQREEREMKNREARQKADIYFDEYQDMMLDPDRFDDLLQFKLNKDFSVFRETNARLARERQGLPPVGMSPEELARIHNEKWSRVLKKIHGVSVAYPCNYWRSPEDFMEKSSE
ncbi:hypothetical protein HDU85_002816 [Gaertneriomyces sp. JEL0708]|nr:hypothetical protein HDU85_002816 [Gaertneriomyces sp. JEL0708]